MTARRPALIARSADIGDVTAEFDFARDSGLLLAVRGGGHDVSGNESATGAWSSTLHR